MYIFRTKQSIFIYKHVYSRSYPKLNFSLRYYLHTRLSQYKYFILVSVDRTEIDLSDGVTTQFNRNLAAFVHLSRTILRAHSTISYFPRSISMNNFYVQSKTESYTPFLHLLHSRNMVLLLFSRGPSVADLAHPGQLIKGDHLLVTTDNKIHDEYEVNFQ